MPRKKRSLKLAEEVAVKPEPKKVASGVVAERIFSALCPICGRAILQKRAIKVGYTTVDRVPYFDSIDWDSNKPFGVSYEASGRGSLQNWEYISREDCPELFEALKSRFLTALGEWLMKGWITEAEVESFLRR